MDPIDSYMTDALIDRIHKDTEKSRTTLKKKIECFKYTPTDGLSDEYATRIAAIMAADSCIPILRDNIQMYGFGPKCRESKKALINVLLMLDALRYGLYLPVNQDPELLDAIKACISEWRPNE